MENVYLELAKETFKKEQLAERANLLKEMFPDMPQDLFDKLKKALMDNYSGYFKCHQQALEEIYSEEEASIYLDLVRKYGWILSKGQELFTKTMEKNGKLSQDIADKVIKEYEEEEEKAFLEG